MVGTLKKNHQGRYALPDGQYFTNGDVINKVSQKVHFMTCCINF